jgi:hypothetical protein
MMSWKTGIEAFGVLKKHGIQCIYDSGHSYRDKKLRSRKSDVSGDPKKDRFAMGPARMWDATGVRVFGAYPSSFTPGHQLTRDGNPPSFFQC